MCFCSQRTTAVSCIDQYVVDCPSSKMKAYSGYKSNVMGVIETYCVADAGK